MENNKKKESKGTEAFQEAIKRYLDDLSVKDALFAETYKKETKSIEECCNFIIGEVQKSGRCGFADDEIFGLAVHYYDEDSIKDIKKTDCKVVVNHEIQLSEEEKQELKEKAKTEFFNSQMSKQRELNKPKPKPKQEKNTDNQLSLF